MVQAEQYGRMAVFFAKDSGIDRVQFTGPDGLVITRPAFVHQPARFHYDIHGYEQTAPCGDSVLSVRFTPVLAGSYAYQALSGDVTVDRLVRLLIRPTCDQKCPLFPSRGNGCGRCSMNHSVQAGPATVPSSEAPKA